MLCLLAVPKADLLNWIKPCAVPYNALFFSLYLFYLHFHLPLNSLVSEGSWAGLSAKLELLTAGCILHSSLNTSFSYCLPRKTPFCFHLTCYFGCLWFWLCCWLCTWWAAEWEHLKVAFSQQMSYFSVSLSFCFRSWISFSVRSRSSRFLEKSGDFMPDFHLRALVNFAFQKQTSFLWCGVLIACFFSVKIGWL